VSQPDMPPQLVTANRVTPAQITTDVDDDPRAAYFRQAKNGLYIRMALLKLATKDRIIAS
jgi:aspartate carbamoyltransferase catalytic subunit